MEKQTKLPDRPLMSEEQIKRLVLAAPSDLLQSWSARMYDNNPHKSPGERLRQGRWGEAAENELARRGLPIPFQR